MSDDRQGAVTPERIMTYIGGYRASALVSAAAAHRLFTHLDAGPVTADELAARAGIAPRGALALLDGLVALGLVEVADGRYRNAPDAAAFLVDDRPGSLAAMARLSQGMMAQDARLAEAARTGAPVIDHALHDTEDHAFWHELVPAIAPLAVPNARVAAAELRVADAGAPAILDVGGGSGAFAATLLQHNPAARATQVDGPVVNRIARGLVDKMGVGERFRFIDGDMRSVDFGAGEYDIVIYSNIAHGEGPESNRALFAKMRRALRPGGALVVSDFILADDRTSGPGVGTFHATMLLGTRQGGVYRRADYLEWANGAGFTDVRFVPAAGPSTLVIARERS